VNHIGHTDLDLRPHVDRETDLIKKEETEEKVIVITKRKNITEIQDQGLSQKIA